jgi:hypothetical protein
LAQALVELGEYFARRSARIKLAGIWLGHH